MNTFPPRPNIEPAVTVLGSIAPQAAGARPASRAAASPIGWQANAPAPPLHWPPSGASGTGGPTPGGSGRPGGPGRSARVMAIVAAVLAVGAVGVVTAVVITHGGDTNSVTTVSSSDLDEPDTEESESETDEPAPVDPAPVEDSAPVEDPAPVEEPAIPPVVLPIPPSPDTPDTPDTPGTPDTPETPPAEPPTESPEGSPTDLPVVPRFEVGQCLTAPADRFADPTVVACDQPGAVVIVIAVADGKEIECPAPNGGGPVSKHTTTRSNAAGSVSFSWCTQPHTGGTAASLSDDILAVGSCYTTESTLDDQVMIDEGPCAPGMYLVVGDAPTSDCSAHDGAGGSGKIADIIEKLPVEGTGWWCSTEVGAP